MLKLIQNSPKSLYLLSSFNTSHVKVNQLGQHTPDSVRLVSIHPMLKLIDYAINADFLHGGFNTSHVKVNHCVGSKSHENNI